VKHYYNLK